MKSDSSKRQSSTSSENIVFSIKLGSNNDLFTTKLPKEKHINKLFADSVIKDNSMPMTQSKNSISEPLPQKQEDSSSLVVDVSPKEEDRSLKDFERPSEDSPIKHDEEIKRKEAPPPITSKRKHRMSAKADEGGDSSESEREVEGFSKPQEGTCLKQTITFFS